MIHIVIFSFNRALQLEALLASIKRHWNDTGYRLSVLYNTTDDDFQKGYDILKNDYPMYEFVKETRSEMRYHRPDYCNLFNLKKMLRYKHLRIQNSDFRDLLISMLSCSACKYVMFLTDDSVFIRDVILTKDDLSFIDTNESLNQISLRLGKGISRTPDGITVKDGILEWNFQDYGTNTSWGYNFSVDAHIYSTDLCLHLFRKCIFNNPTTLEGVVCDYVKKNGMMCIGRTFELAFILSFPINMVQNIANNESMNVSVDGLNGFFLSGKRLEYIIPDVIDEFQQYPSSICLTDGVVKEVMVLKK